MDQHRTNDLINRLISRIETKTTDEAEAEMLESADIFLCPKRFSQEKQQFFINTPQVIGFSGELKDLNSYLTVDVLDIPVLITRDELGVLRAFINACAHKGARVVSGRGVQPRMTCKFHGWTYSNDGCLYGRPQEGCFSNNKKDRGLQPLPVSDRSGLIVVGVQPDMSQQRVDNHLQSIEAELSGFDFKEMHFLETRRFDVQANWKLVAGLSYESYHFPTLHRDSVAQWLNPNAVHDFFDQHSRWCFSLKGIEKLKHKDKKQWPRFIPGATSHAFFPGTVMITNPEDAQLIRVEPGATPDTSIVYYSGVCRHKDKMKESLAAYDFGGQAFEQEDLPAAIECQQGLAAAKKDFPIGKNEPVVQFWHKQWREKLIN